MIRDGICLGREELVLLVGKDWERKLINVRKEMERKEYLLNHLEVGDTIYHMNRTEITVLGVDYIEGFIKGKFMLPNKKRAEYDDFNPIDIYTKEENFVGKKLYDFPKGKIVPLKDEDVKSAISYLENKYISIEKMDIENQTLLRWDLFKSEDNELTNDDINILKSYLGKTIVEIKISQVKVPIPIYDGFSFIQHFTINKIQHLIFDSSKSKI
jgi:hypothetical protein